MNEKVWKVGYLWIFVLNMSMTGEVKAACIQTPDCASIGYTETSCETDYLACPFDNTKLKCMPCDSSYRYDCIGDDFKSGDGSTCEGKYMSCVCKQKDYVFSNGKCVCDTSCKVGHIVYSDRTCSACVLPNKPPVAFVVYNLWNAIDIFGFAKIIRQGNLTRTQ